MIKLFCDMGADIPEEIAKKYDINVLTMIISDGEKEYILGKNIDKYKLFDGMEKGLIFSTSQVAYKDFYDSFKEVILNGDDVIYISLSSGISGTFNTAIMAKNALIEEFPDAKIYIEDSLGASLGYGLNVIKTAKLISQNKNIDEILESIRFSAKHTKYIFSVDDLTYLYRGGRLNKAKFIIGSLLNVNPIMHISSENGTLEMIDKARGHKALKKKINSILSEYKEILNRQTIMVLHGDCEEKALELKNSLNDEFEELDIVIKGLDAVIGCHTGRSIIAIVYLDKLYGENDVFEI